MRTRMGSLAVAVRCSIKASVLPDESVAHRTVVGWQGIRFTLPPDWNVTAFSMDRERGYLRVDAPGNSAVTVQIRWTDASKPESGPPTAYSLIAPMVRGWLKRPEPMVKSPTLKTNLEKMFQD